VDQSEVDSLKENHKLNLYGLIDSYPLAKIFYSIPFRLSLLVSIIYAVFVILMNQQYVQLINLIDICIEIFPSLLGFSLGGYALIIGFGNNNLLQSMTRQLKDKNFSLLQLINGTFAFSILLQSLVLTISFIFYIISKLPVAFFLTDIHCKYINAVGLSILFFLGSYSMFQLPKMIINVFNFGQLHHFKLTKERIMKNK